jgi:hypothetical protein
MTYSTFFLSIDGGPPRFSSISRLILAIPKRIAVVESFLFSPSNLADFDDYDRRAQWCAKNIQTTHAQ